MSSVGVATVGVGTAVAGGGALLGIAIVGGVVVLGYAGYHLLNALYKVSNQAVMYGIYTTQKQSLKEKMRELLEGIREENDKEVLDFVRDDFKQLEQLVNRLMEEFTFEKFTTGDISKWLEVRINAINQQVIEMKKRINEFLEAKECRSELIRRWKEIEEFDEYSEIKQLNTYVKQIGQLPLSKLKVLIVEIQQVSEYIKSYRVTEDEMKKVSLPKGEGVLCKEIRKMVEGIKALKTSSQPVLYKQRLLEEYQKNIKVLLEQYEILKNVKLSDQHVNITVDKFILQERWKEEGKILEKVYKVKEEIDKYLYLIKEMDQDEYIKLEGDVSFPSQIDKDSFTFLRNLRDRVKIAYGRLKEACSYTKVYKEQILAILNDKELEDTNIKELGKELLNRKYIESKEFWKFFQAYRDAKREETLKKERIKTFEKFLQKLQSKGYSLVDPESFSDIQENEILELKTPLGECYKVQVKMDESGNIITRFAKEIENPSESEYERQRDIEEAKKWCRVYKDTIESMNGDGYRVDIRAVQEPEDVGIIYVERGRGGKVSREKSRTRLREQRRR